jgi:hypothetical protein
VFRPACDENRPDKQKAPQGGTFDFISNDAAVGRTYDVLVLPLPPRPPMWPSPIGNSVGIGGGGADTGAAGFLDAAFLATFLTAFLADVFTTRFFDAFIVFFFRAGAAFFVFFDFFALLDFLAFLAMTEPPKLHTMEQHGFDSIMARAVNMKTPGRGE